MIWPPIRPFLSFSIPISDLDRALRIASQSYRPRAAVCLRARPCCLRRRGSALTCIPAVGYTTISFYYFKNRRVIIVQFRLCACSISCAYVHPCGAASPSMPAPFRGPATRAPPHPHACTGPAIVAGGGNRWVSMQHVEH
jgi:hypothetical protein